MLPSLRAADWIVVGGYFAVVAWIGLRAARGQSTTRDYFLGGRSLPWWAAALSIIATETSAVTLMGTPRMAFEGDWSFLQFVCGFVVGRIFLAFFFVHVFFREELVTVYGFLERRFGAGARFTAATLFLIGRVLGSGVRLYAGCLALEVAAGIPIEHAIVVLGVFATAYTLFGGIKAVVWTDVLLGLTFMAAGVASLAYLGWNLPGGLDAIFAKPGAGSTLPTLLEKTRVVIWGWDLQRNDTLLAGILGGFFITLATHGTDQDVAQRLLTCRNSRDGTLSILGSALMILPLMALFLAVGTGLYFYYRGSGENVTLPQNLDHLFPLFIVRELPTGIRGFVMAGLLAASVSSFTSVLNALASTTVSDFYQPLTRRWGVLPTETQLLRVSRGSTLGWGVLLMLVALGFRESGSNVLDVAYATLNYFYGGLLGAFLLGIYSRRGTSRSVVWGMMLSVPAVLVFQLEAYLAHPSKAPVAAQDLMALLPSAVRAAILDWVPPLAYKYWIVVGTAVTVLIGALGRKQPLTPGVVK